MNTCPIATLTTTNSTRITMGYDQKLMAKVLTYGATNATTSCMDDPGFYSQPWHWQPV